MEAERKRRVLLVDDSPAFRGLLQWYLGTLPEVEVIAEATDGEQAIAAVARLEPGVPRRAGGGSRRGRVARQGGARRSAARRDRGRGRRDRCDRCDRCDR